MVWSPATEDFYVCLPVPVQIPAEGKLADAELFAEIKALFAENPDRSTKDRPF